MSAALDVRRADAERGDYRAALICAVLANINRDPKKRPQPFTVADFMARPADKEEPTEMNPNDQLALVKVMNRTFGGDEA